MQFGVEGDGWFECHLAKSEGTMPNNVPLGRLFGTEEDK